MSFGFKVVLLLAALIYAIGVLALTRIPELRVRSSDLLRRVG
jgi:hypothetical protein